MTKLSLSKQYLWFLITLLTFGSSLGVISGVIAFFTFNNKFSYVILYFVIVALSIFYCKFQIELYKSWNNDENEKIENRNSVNLLKYRFNITDEDKIVFQHLFDRHKNLLSFVDVLDTKFSTAIALNGLILSFTFFRADDASQTKFFILGLFFILSSILIGIYGYFPRTYFAGMNVDFYDQYDDFSWGEGIKELKEQLTLDIKRNEKIQNSRATLFTYVLIFNIAGLTTLIVGYYV